MSNFCLALDTSTDLGSVAVLRAGQPLAAKTWSRVGSHGEHLTPALETCLASAKIEAKDLNYLALGHGPGSFTGVRIAVNAARSLSYALNIPVYAFDTTEILAADVTRNDLPLAVLLNAHKNLIFASTFIWRDQKWQRALKLEAYDLKTLETHIQSPHLCVGDAFDEFSSVFSPHLRAHLVRDPSMSDRPQAEVLGKLAHQNLGIRQPLAWKSVQALYIRASGAEEKLREGPGGK